MFYLSLFFAVLALVWSLAVAPEGSFRAGDMFPALEAWFLAVWFLVLHLLFGHWWKEKAKKKNAKDGNFRPEKIHSGKRAERSFNGKQIDTKGSEKRIGGLEKGQSEFEDQKKSLAPNLLSVEQGRKHFGWHCCDTLVLLFVGTLLVSFWHLYSRELGNVRYAENALSVWLIGPVIYFFFRLLAGAKRGKSVTAILLAIIFSVALAESLFGIYAYTVRDPAFRKAYQKDPEAILTAEGFNYPKGSPERILLEKRLLASTEPLGTFGLTNTLGGVLTPWLIVLIGLMAWTLVRELKNFFATKRRGGPSKSDLAENAGSVKVGGVDLKNIPLDPFRNSLQSISLEGGILLRMIVLLTLAIIPVSYCLILTKSRSAVLAVFLGIILFAFLYMIFIRRRFPQSERRSFLVMAVFFSSVFILGILGTALAFLTGILDREVFTEAGKSLGYRLEYWTASANMIKDHLFFGVGPGNFQNIYPQYILPQSSEVIADPHNFVFEITALFGVPAIVLFLLFFLRAFWPILMIRKTESGEENRETQAELRISLLSSEQTDLPIVSNDKAGDLNKVAAGGIFLGGVLTFLGSIFTTAPLDPFYILLFWGSSIVALFSLFYIKKSFLPIFSSSEQRMFYDLFLIVTVVAVLMNLGAAGGIAYPAVMTIVWVCFALMINRIDNAKVSGDFQKSGDQKNCHHCNRNNSEIKEVPKSNSFKVEKNLEKDFARFQKKKRVFLFCLVFMLPIIFLFIVFHGHLPAIKGEMFVERGRTHRIGEEELNFNNLKSPEVFCVRDPYSIEMGKLYYSLMLSSYVQSVEQLKRDRGTENRENRILGNSGFLVPDLRKESLYWSGYEEARKYLQKIAPNSASIREFLCESALDSWRRSGEVILLKGALEDADLMTNLFPTDAKKHFLRGQILSELKQSDAALSAFREALRLDELTPHEDRKLNAESRKIASDYLIRASDQSAGDRQIMKESGTKRIIISNEGSRKTK